MWRLLEYCLALVSLTLVGGSFLQNIRDDYCELYLKASKIRNKTCQQMDSSIITNEYKLDLVNSKLLLNWTQVNPMEWHTFALTREIKNLTSLVIWGIRSSEDSRLRPASFYLKELNVEHVERFLIKSEFLTIREQDIHYKEGPIYLFLEFERSVNVGRINDYVAASTGRIEYLSITGLLINGSELCTHFKFFGLPELQKDLEILRMDGQMTVKMKCFENYRRLTFIFYDGPYEPFENLTALICDSVMYCKCTIGTNGLRCPAGCECSYIDLFRVRCFEGNRTQIPPLPIPIDGEIRLDFPGNQLSQLPNHTLPGYIEVIMLDVSDNKITSLSIHQLPRKLSSLNISNNPIKTVDSGVAKYLKSVDRVFQDGIRWIANCDEEPLVQLLESISGREDVFFEQLSGNCPRGCKCCLDGGTESFLINCSSRFVNYRELPDHSPYQLSLLLVNNGLTELPENLPPLLVTYNTANLDLRNNSLRSLDVEVVNFYNNHSETTIELSGNPWTCYCKDKPFIFLLKSRNPLEYSVALDRCNISMCPESCMCCLDDSESSAVTVDCRGQQLTRFPPPPDSVTSLDLRNNNISEIDLPSQQFMYNLVLSTRVKVFLYGNPWICTCETSGFFFFAKNISQHIPDYARLHCSNLGKRLALVDESEICPSYFIYPLILIVFIMVLIMALNAFVYFKQPILIWFYEHEICMSMAVRKDLERLKKFDAFLSFTHKDEHLIEEFVETLEKGQSKFRLCFYLRDWQVGASIPECIIRSVKDSRRIIILMTKNFVESTWGKLEFRLALHATSKDRCKRLIVILYPDVENFDDLDSELKAYMVLNTYLRRDSPNFWNKLIYSMPHDTLLKAV